MRHLERHRTHRTGWLRAAVLGANDGIVSTASLVLGVAAAGASPQSILVAGVAGLVAGAMSMAAGEYVSVSSQADTERADLARESKELAASPEQELAELAGIYVKRGLDATLAASVAAQLTQHDALGAQVVTSSASPLHWPHDQCKPHWHRPVHLPSVLRYLC
jgi:VIT1/CCC1 family predicted Fe2+/Mn2+ transporter